MLLKRRTKRRMVVLKKRKTKRKMAVVGKEEVKQDGYTGRERINRRSVPLQLVRGREISG